MAPSTASPTFVLPGVNLQRYEHIKMLDFIERNREGGRTIYHQKLSYLTKRTTKTIKATASPTIRINVATPFRRTYKKSFNGEYNM